MSRSPLLTIVLAVLCGIGAGGLALTKPKPPPVVEGITEEIRRPQDLQRFARTMPGEPDLEIVQLKAPGRIDWLMKKPLPDTPAQFTTINPILHALVYLNTSGRIDPAQAGVDPSVFGFDSPAAVVRIEGPTERLNLTLGDKEIYGDRYFFRVERNGEEMGIFTMSEYEFKSFTVPWQEFEDKRLIPVPFNPAAVGRITLKFKREVANATTNVKETSFDTVAIALDVARQTATVVEPKDLSEASINLDTVGRLLYGLSSITAQEKTAYDAASDARWGFDSPALEVRLQFNPAAHMDDLHYVFGKTVEDEYYGVAHPVDRVGRLDAKAFLGLPQSLEGEGGYRATNLYNAAWDIRRIRIQDVQSGNALVVERDPDRRSEKPWTVVSPTGLAYDSENLRGVFDPQMGGFFTEGKVEQFVERKPTDLTQFWFEGKPDSVVTFTIQGPQGPIERVFRFGRKVPGSVHAYVQHDRNEEIVAISPFYLDKLKKLWLNFVNRRIFEVDFGGLDGLVVEAPRVPEQHPFSYAVKPRGDREWTWDVDATSRPDHAVYQNHAAELAGHFYDMSVEAFISWDPRDRAAFNLDDGSFQLRVTVKHRDGPDRALRVSYGSGPHHKKVFIMFEDDGIICAYNERLYDLLVSQLRRR